MKKNLFAIILIIHLCQHIKVLAQTNLNSYKYVFVPTLKYNNGNYDIFSISSTIRGKFIEKGFNVLTERDFNSIPPDLRDNNCLLLNTEIAHSEYKIGYRESVTIRLKNCKGEYILNKTSKGDGFERATVNAVEDLKISNHFFDSRFIIQPFIGESETSTETESTLKTYFDNYKSLNQLEGIYKNLEQNSSFDSFYKFGIKKVDQRYIAIIIESGSSNWKKGDIKAYFEPTSIKNVYSVTWLLNNKTKFETLGNLENDAILNIELKGNNSEKRILKFLKIYPTNISEKVEGNSNTKSSGSGFFVSPNGIIATNAHVVEDAKNIRVHVKNESESKIYKAKLELKDSKNDVAIIRIDDPEFKELNNLPYTLSEKAEIGEKSFTIGFPLNDIMGSNFKITDGIISSNTGLNDDVRFYQISVPLQPGNSGGPLFNKNGNIIGITTAKLNSNAVGTNIENVNYAIKIQYLENILNMLPSYTKPKNAQNLNGKELQEQVKVLKNYVCIIEIEN